MTDLVSELDELFAGDVLIPEETHASTGDWRWDGRSISSLFIAKKTSVGLTEHGKITDQVFRVFGLEQVCELEIFGELPADRRGDVEMLMQVAVVYSETFRAARQ